MVKDCQNHNRVSFDCVMNGIRKTAKKRAAHTGPDRVKALRVRRYAGENLIHGGSEFGS
jgi:hypothetical protein